MNYIFLLTVLQILLRIQVQSFMEDRYKDEHICYIGDSTFCKLYNWQFSSASNIQILLLSRKYRTIVESYISNILYYLNVKCKFQKSHTIKDINITWNSENTVNHFKIFNKYECCDICEKYHYQYSDLIQTKRIREYSGDLNYASLIVVSDLDDLKLFLNLQLEHIFVKPRGFYIINILQYNVTKVDIELKQIFDVLWSRIGTLNVKIQFPCSSNYTKILGYNPFVYNIDTWGVLQSFDINDILSNLSSYQNNLRNMQGYPVNISMFNRQPTAVKNIPFGLKSLIYYNIISKSGEFGGVDGIVLAYIANYLNFTAHIISPAVDREYGYKEKNGTFVGSLGDVIYHNVIASFNGRFISHYDTNQIEFTYPINADYLCLLVPKAKKIPHWMNISNCFKQQTWLSIFIMYILISICWSIVNNITITSKRYIKHIDDAFFEILAILVAVPLRTVRLYNQKLFIGVCLLFNIIFVGIFQGSLYKSYTNEYYFPDINSLEELDTSGLYIATNSKSLTNSFDADPKPVMKRLKDKIFMLNGSSSLAKAAYDQDSAAFERKQDANLRIKTEFTRKIDGAELLHVMNECPWSYHVSYIVPVGSPFLPVFNVLINKFLEAGLISKWHLDTVDGLIIEKRVHPLEHSNTLKPFTLEDMQAAFYLVTLGLGISILIFIIELCFVRCEFNIRKKVKILN